MRSIALTLILASCSFGQDRPSQLLKKADKIKDSEIETVSQASRDNMLKLHLKIHDEAEKYADDKWGRGSRGLKEYNRAYDYQYNQIAEPTLLDSKFTVDQFLRIVGEETDKKNGKTAKVAPDQVLFAARDEDSLKRFVDLIRAKDDDRAEAMVNSGRVAVIKSNCSLVILSIDKRVSLIRVLSGDHAGLRLHAQDIESWVVDSKGKKIDK
jgi:hypothetical protein